jgi:putative ferrous iron transport protein C
MSLLDLKEYLRQHGQATLNDLSYHFRTEPDAVRTMLEHWQRKGKVTRLQNSGGCGKNCAGCCFVSQVDIYVWQEHAPDAKCVPTSALEH